MDARTINLSMPLQLYKAVDYQAKNEARTKSGLIQEAIRFYLTRRGEWQSLFDYGSKTAKKMKVKEKDLERLIDECR